MTEYLPPSSTRRNFLRGAALGAFGLALVRQAPALSQGTISAISTGARGDGQSDDSRALAEVLNSGNVVDGEGRTYAVAGDVRVGRAFKGLRNAKLIQLDPAGSQRRTLQVQGASNFTIDNVSVSRGGDGSEHPDRTEIGRTGGVFIMGCHDFTLRGIQVTGGGIGSALAVVDSTGFTCDDLNVSNLWYRLASHPSDDAIHGSLFVRCSNFTVNRARISDIGGTDGKTDTHHNNRAIAVTGCDTFKFVSPDVRRVGQGIDVSGSLGNRDFEIVDGLAEDCFTVGFKFANSAQDGVIRDSTARRAGWCGFVVSGPSSQGIPKPHGLTFENCLAQDVAGTFQPRSSFGFGVLRARYEPTYPRDVTFRNCRATSGGGGHQMRFGFRNDIPAEVTEGKPNRVIGCSAEGFAEAEFHGF